MRIETSPFGKSDGQEITCYRLINDSGAVVKLINYGAICTSVEVPDRSGQQANVMLSFPSLDGYLQRHPYFGATVGRFANRIGFGTFQLEGKRYSLATNLGEHHLHGGNVGFDKKIWTGTTTQTDDSLVVAFHAISPDGDEGYPGRLAVTAQYRWSNDNELSFEFSATTDQTTVLNLTNHGYWNLAGAGCGDILGTRLQLFCDRFLAVDDALIPTGRLDSVEGTPLDFRQVHAIGERIELLPKTKGYDHCLVVNGEPGTLRRAALAVDPGSGRVMEVMTTQPGMQLYTGNHLGGSESSGGFRQHEGFCLETQAFPDAPNKPHFPSSQLKPGEKYQQTTVHKFSVL